MSPDTMQLLETGALFVSVLGVVFSTLALIGAWEDWQDALDEVEVDDCRWTPCFDCGVCPQLDTAIQIGPTGRALLPLTPVADLSKTP